MVRKGNLLRNGDFEFGDKTDWILRPFNLGDEACVFDLVTGSPYGNMGVLEVPEGNKECYIMYDKECDFEECEAYFYSLTVWKDSGRFLEGVLYGLDDNGNYLDFIPFGQITEEGVWKSLRCILRHYNEFSHFKIGLRGLSYDDLAQYEFRDAKLLPLKSVKSIYIGEYIRKDDLSSDFDYYGTCACLGRCKFYSLITVPQLSGTNVTLTVRISLYTQDWLENVIIVEHSVFTEPSSDILSIEMPEVVKYRIQYIFEGDSPVADIRHDIRIIPL